MDHSHWLGLCEIMIKVYCDTGAYLAEIKELEKRGVIKLFQFKYENKNKKINNMAAPSNPTIEELKHYTVNDFVNTGITIQDMSCPSEKYREIQKLIGKQNSLDIKHLDSAYMTGCTAFLTSDMKDIGSKKDEVFDLLGIRVFHIPNELDNFIHFCK